MLLPPDPITRFFDKQHYKQRQAETGKESSKY